MTEESDKTLHAFMQMISLEVGEYICHFTSLSTALEKILATGELRFSPAACTRDPRESQDWSIGLRSKGCDLLDDAKVAKLRQVVDMTNRVKRRTKLLCATMDGSTDNSRSAGRAWTNALMWTHYGDIHKGACLILDRARLDLAIRDAMPSDLELQSGAVTYQNVSHLTPAFLVDGDLVDEIGIDPTIIQHVRNHGKVLFLTKNQEWAGENEFRWIFVGENDEYWYFDYKDSFVGILLGAACPAVYGTLAEELARERGGSFLGWMSWCNGDAQPPAMRPTFDL